MPSILNVDKVSLDDEKTAGIAAIVYGKNSAWPESKNKQVETEPCKKQEKKKLVKP